MVASNELIAEVVIRDGASGPLGKITEATVRSTRAMDAAERTVERYTAKAFPLEGALQQLVRAENALVRAQDLGKVSAERRSQILDAMWRSTIGAAEAARENAIALERERAAADRAQASINTLAGAQLEIGRSARDSAAAFQPLLDQLEREEALLQQINQERGRQVADNAQGAFNRQLGVAPGSGAGSAAASAAVFQDRASREEQARALVEKHDMAAAAQRRYSEAVRQADQDLKDNFITTEQHQRVLVGENAILTAVTGAQGRFGRSLGLTGFQMQNLSYQINDVVTGLAMGQRPMQVLLQQGGQIAQIFPRAAGAIFSFTGALVALPILIGVTLAAAFIKGQEEAAAFTRAVQLTGNAAGVTAGQLDEMVGAAADASNIGASAARSIATQMVASGKIGSEVIGRLLAITEDYAAATDQSTKEAGAALTKLYVDPLKGAQELDQAYNLLTDSQRQYIRTLVEQGRREDAQLALADAQQQRMKNLANELGYLEWAWNEVAGAASDAWDAMKGIGRPETLEEQIEEARRAASGIGARGIAYTDPEAQALLDRLLIQKAAADAQAADDARNAKLRDETKVLGDVARGYDTTVTKQRELENQSIRVQSALAGIREKLAGMRNDGGAQGPLGELQRDLALLEMLASDTALAFNALRTPLQESQAQTAIARRLSSLTPGQRGPQEAYLTTLDSARHGSPEEARQAEATATDARTRAIIQLNQAINDNNAVTEINIQGAIDLGEAYFESGAAALRAQAAQKAAQQALQTGADAELQARLALNEVVAKGYADASKQLAQLRDEARAREAIAAAAGDGAAAQHAAELALKIDQATRSIRDLAAAADPDLAARLNALADGIGNAITRIDEADRTAAINEAIRAQEESLALTRAELGLVGSTNDQHDITIAMLQAKLELQRMNVDAASAEGQAYLRNAEAQARLNNELRQQTRTQQELDSFWEDAIDKSGEFAANIAKGEQSFQSLRETGEEVLNELIDLFVELAYENPLKNYFGFGGDTGRPTLETAGNALFGNGAGIPEPTGTAIDPLYVSVVDSGFGGGSGFGGQPGQAPGSFGGPGGGGFQFPGIGTASGAPSGGGVPEPGSAPGVGFGAPGTGGTSTYGPGSFNAAGAGIGAGIGGAVGGAAGYYLGDAIGGKSGGKIGAILGTILGTIAGAYFGGGFENGGVMTSRGPLPLRRYSEGGIARSPQLAMFGEGSTPEAYVPLRDGRAIDVNLRTLPSARANDNSAARSGTSISVNQTINFPRPTNGFKRSRQQEFGMASEALMRTLRSVG